MILPLSVLFAAGHAVFRARGFAMREVRSGTRRVLVYDRAGRGPAPPVVLVHGLFGFDRIGVPGASALDGDQSGVLTASVMPSARTT